MKNPIITLCGSTKFKDEILAWNRDLTLGGAIVLMPGVFAHSGDYITEQQKEELDQLHKRKIAMSDAIVVVNPNGYIGNSTREEIGFAKALGLKIFYTSELS